MQFKEIPREQVHLLASILHQCTSEPWVQYAERVYCIEPQLDRPLLRPDFLHRLVQLPQSHYAPLCGLHKILNAKIVHQIFVLVASEVGLRLNSLAVAGRDKLGHETWDCSILNLRSLHGAWLHPEVFWDTFGHTLDVPQDGYSNEDYMAKWVRDEDKCEACLLARIGGDLNTVLDLHMVVKSRTHTRSVKKYREPKLNKLIEGWLKAWELHYGGDEWKQKLKWNNLRAERLKIIRRQLGREKQRTRTAHKAENVESHRHRKPKISEPLMQHDLQRPKVDSALDGQKASQYTHSQETMKFYLSPEPTSLNGDPSSRTLDTDEDDDELEIRHTLHDTENDIIDCYAALISTPFLPGMGSDEHRKRSSKLGHHRTTMLTEYNDKHWPMVGDEAVQERLARSQSTRHRRPSNYSESVYSQTHRRLSATPSASSPPPCATASSNLGRTLSVPGRRATDKSWITASVTPSATTTRASASQNITKRCQKHDQRFDAIVEETPSPRQSSDTFTYCPVSPIQEDEFHRTISPGPPSEDSDDEESPISPLSPIHPSKVKHQRSCQQNNGRSGSNSSKRDQTYRPYSGTPDQHHPRSNKISSRLSKPFDEPSVRPATPSKSSGNGKDNLPAGKTSKFRETVDTDMTRWSDLYGAEAERIRQLEEQLKGLDTALGSKSERKARRR